jgi:integrase
MKPVAETLHLQKRGGTWYYHRRVPSHLVEKLGKQVIKASLRTTDKREAKRLRALHDVESDALFASASASDTSISAGSHPKKVPFSVLIEYVRAAVEEDDRNSAKAFVLDPPEDAEQLEDMRIDAEIFLEMFSEPGAARTQPSVGSFARKVLARAGAESSAANDHPEFLELVRRALMEIYRRKADRYHDRHDRPFYDELFNPERPSPVTFQALVDVYLAEQQETYELNGVSQKRWDKVCSHAKTIVEIVGPTIPVTQIDDDVVQTVRSVLAKLPSNRTKLYPDIPLALAIERAQKEKRPVISSSTQGFYLEIFSGLLRVAVRKKLLPHNPCSDAQPLKKSKLPSDQRRLPFANEQLKKFFLGSFYLSCAPDAPSPYDKPDRSWRFWMPLIMLFSGARPNEIAQLRCADVKVTGNGTRYLDLTNDGKSDAITVKTASSRRRIPVHSHLQRFGFLAFVEDRRKADGDNAPLFPALRPDKYGNRAWYAAKRFNEVFLPAVMAVGERQSLYSLRHNVRDALRAVNAPPEALLAIAGWAPGGKAISDSYGDPGNPDHYIKWVEEITYPELDLSFLYV